MTLSTKQLYANFFDDFFNDSRSIGFDSMRKRIIDFNSLSKTPSYPPYNIRKMDDNQYVVEIAVAGFQKNNIEITFEDGILKISGNINSEENNNYLYKGIAGRAFTLNFSVIDTVEVKNADISNGLLRIFLENIIPDQKKLRKIEINGDSSNLELLTE